jgi:Fe-S-cluster containining protein
MDTMDIMDTMENDFQPLSVDDTFLFRCTPQVACFNACCRDLYQVLTPHDVLRLKGHLGISSTEFLERYCLQGVGPETGLPVVTLKPADTTDRACCFVTDEGCRVYSSRPASCRIYPLARAVSRSRETGRVTEHFALLREPHCQGHAGGRRQTVREWIREQGLSECHEMNDRLLEIISLKSRCLPGALDLRRRHMFHLALYDIDAFREHVSDKGLPPDLSVAADTLESVRNDDIALLKLAHEWVKHVLFGGCGP